jgi:hypothetical protein
VEEEKKVEEDDGEEGKEEFKESRTQTIIKNLKEKAKIEENKYRLPKRRRKSCDDKRVLGSQRDEDEEEKKGDSRV